MIFAASYSRVFTLALIAASLVATGCNAGASVSNAATPPPAPEVSVTTVHSEDTPIYSEYTAQTFARDMVEVRGRVDGYIDERLFETGSDVKAGQPLYILDLRPYEADVQKVRGELSQGEADKEFAANQVGLLQAEADLAQAQANLVKAQQDVARLQPLVKQEAARNRISTTRWLHCRRIRPACAPGRPAWNRHDFRRRLRLKRQLLTWSLKRRRFDLRNSIWNTQPFAPPFPAALETAWFRLEGS